jgi:GT2 family glycosyltransferase
MTTPTPTHNRSKPHASVVIRTYTDKRWDVFVKSVESVLTQTVPLQLVLVVDHNPALLERVRTRFTQPHVLVVDNPFARGSGGAWNAGIAAAEGEFIAFIDDDAQAHPDWLEQLQLGYTDADIVGVGGSIRPYWECGRPRWFPHEFDWVVGCTYRGVPDKIAPVRNLIGCNMSFRREAFLAVPGFRTDIGHMGGRPIGCDETEFCIRLHQRFPEKIMIQQPNAIVEHHVPQSRSTVKYFRERCFYEGQSKAMVARLVGSQDGLSSERTHALQVLPAGVMRGLRDTLKGDVFGMARAAMITFGLGVTVAGYVLALVRMKLRLGGDTASKPASVDVKDATPKRI